MSISTRLFPLSYTQAASVMRNTCTQLPFLEILYLSPLPYTPTRCIKLKTSDPRDCPSLSSSFHAPTRPLTLKRTIREPLLPSLASLHFCVVSVTLTGDPQNFPSFISSLYRIYWTSATPSSRPVTLRTADSWQGWQGLFVLFYFC